MVTVAIRLASVRQPLPTLIRTSAQGERGTAPDGATPAPYKTCSCGATHPPLKAQTHSIRRRDSARCARPPCIGRLTSNKCSHICCSNTIGREQLGSLARRARRQGFLIACLPTLL